ADPVDGLALAPLWGLGRVIAHEHPELGCRCIDLDPGEAPQAAAAQARAELASADGEDQVALRAQQRYVARLVRAQALPEQSLQLRAEASYLITGGLGGLGLLTAQRLVERGARHLILLGRHGPDMAAQASIAELEREGAQ